jgi:hypothetical protein
LCDEGNFLEGQVRFVLSHEVFDEIVATHLGATFSNSPSISPIRLASGASAAPATGRVCVQDHTL